MSTELSPTSPVHPAFAAVGYSMIDVNVHADRVDSNAGGAAFFVALAASRLLDSVGLVSTIGGDFSSPHLNRVLPEGIHRYPARKSARSTQTYFDESDHTKRHISVEWGVAPLLEGKHIPSAWLNQLQILHLATMIPTQQFAILDFIRTHAAQAQIAIDTDAYLLNDEHHHDTLQKSFAAADIGFVNRQEYLSLGRTIDAMPEAIVKLDADGAIYMQHGRVVAKTRAPRVNVVDATGAGDVFAGTFLAARVRGKMPLAALELATNIASLSVTRPGIDHLFDEGGL